jgi:hypothetical protein
MRDGDHQRPADALAVSEARCRSTRVERGVDRHLRLGRGYGLDAHADNCRGAGLADTKRVNTRLHGFDPAQQR